MLNIIQLLKKPKILLILVLLCTSFFRLYRIDYPNKYVFDEVYHAFTAREYLSARIEAWEWWTAPPPGVAYEWTHPPLAKEIMTISMFLMNTQDAWAWRLPGVLFGVLSTYLVYLLGLKLLKNETASVIAAFLFSIDGLNFVQSRTGMNDSYYVAFVLASLLFFLNRKMFLSAVFFGFAISSKWAALYLVLIYAGIYAYKFINNLTRKPLKSEVFSFLKTVLFFTLIPPLIYVLTYTPFLVTHRPEQFIQLQQQMWWYHTGLKATHDYSSPWWSWPLNLYPVWYFVDYHEDTMSNIFASGNPVLFWVGSVAIILTLLEFIRTRSEKLLIILLGFFAFWLPWSLSPRIMFLYHFSPCIPFLSLALAHQLHQEFEASNRKKMALVLLFLIFLSFLLVFPILTGIPLPRNFVDVFFLMNLTKNPFI